VEGQKLKKILTTHGKPAGVHCVQLLPDLRCALFGKPERPVVCVSLRPTEEMCGSSREAALAHLYGLELATKPWLEPSRRWASVSIPTLLSPMWKSATTIGGAVSNPRRNREVATKEPIEHKAERPEWTVFASLRSFVAKTLL